MRSPNSRIDVQIDMKSVDSMDKDRDTTIRGPDIFDVAHSPTAHYVTHSFTKTAAGYSAVGALTLRGVTKDVPIEFQVHAGRGGRKTRRERQDSSAWISAWGRAIGRAPNGWPTR